MEQILVIDFGGQYNRLIARRVRELGVYCEVVGCAVSVEEILARKPKGVIFTGGPSSVTDENAPFTDKGIFSLGIPILGICYGAQFIALALGGEIARAEKSAEFGRTGCKISKNALFSDIPDEITVWMSHNDYIKTVPPGFNAVATTDKCPVAAMSDDSGKLYALQFHPEVSHTQYGKEILRNFLYGICGCSGEWTMKSYAVSALETLRHKIGNGKVLLALSGGVDSSVTCALLAKAAGKNLTCVFVDHGFMRKNEGDEIEAVFGKSGGMGINFTRVNAAGRFLAKLTGVSDPEQKRKLIGEEFIRTFEDEAKKIGKIDFLAQGTIYPDVIESGLGDSAVIKSHHNVGGLPDTVDFREITEPLRMLFKDEVRKLGTQLGLPDRLVWRQPFPGPGLAIRIIGEITSDKLDILREADAIFREEIIAANLDRETDQYFAVLTNNRSVGVMGDERTYGYTIALRGVTTSDFMTADFARIPYDVLERVSVRIVNEVKNVNRICYDITSKPPATIEWE